MAASSGSATVLAARTKARQRVEPRARCRALCRVLARAVSSPAPDEGDDCGLDVGSGELMAMLQGGRSRESGPGQGSGACPLPCVDSFALSAVALLRS